MLEIKDVIGAALASPFVGYLLIFLARVVDVTLATLRLLLLVRAKRLRAAAIGFVEILIFITVLGTVLNNLNEWPNLLAYALGFATGNFTGGLLEEKLALGLLTVQVIPRRPVGEEMARSLRDEGFGVTLVPAEGKEGTKTVLFISIRRRVLPKLIDLVEGQDPDAFINVFETKRALGGVFTYRKGK